MPGSVSSQGAGVLLLWCSMVIISAQVINRAPHFIPQTGDMSKFSLAEDTPVGTPVYQLKGIDPEEGQLRYSISGQYFSVDRSTGVVTLVKPLDREDQGILEVIISITDEAVANTEPNTVSLRREIPIRDSNDNPPIFHNRPYSANISEAAEVGMELKVSPIMLVTDRDEGTNADVRVSCYSTGDVGDSEACDMFTVVSDKIEEGQFEVRIFLKRRLDFESRSSYVLAVRASDGSPRPLSAFASVAVAVTDVQDQPPVFLNAPYSATVAENTLPNTSIMEILAKDGDSENTRPVLITLESDTLSYFRVSQQSGGRATLLTTDEPIDRENSLILQNGGVYTFYVKATEMINNEVPSDYSVTQVTIVVTDIDDHIPTFNKDVFDVSIPENIEAGSPVPGLSIYVEDNDLGTNSRYNLSLRDISNSYGVFTISTNRGEGKTPIGVKVKDASKLDFDIEDVSKRYFSFDIVASVSGEEKSSARININLLDTNDNSPEFEMSSYRVNVLENTTIDTKIANVTATDKDHGIFGTLEYSLTGFGYEFFRTEMSDGGLYVNRPLDYEKQKSYSLTLVAKDGGGKVTTTNVFVEILDVNDNAPMFENDEYTRIIRDGATSFEPQFVVRASDSDGPTQGGGKVTYSIESDNSISNNGNVFVINEVTGEIGISRAVNSMDTPRGQYELVVRAVDHGIPPLHNDTRVFIRVGVPGNQRPTFRGNYHAQASERSNGMAMNYISSVGEDAPPGTVVSTVTANDPDGSDERLTYHIVGGSKDNFVIDQKSGVITVSADATLDRDVNQDSYQVIVTAVDDGTPIAETATTTVFVNIKDVNDKPPSFKKLDTTVYISERTNIAESVATMEASDTDLNAKLKYEIIKPVKASSNSGIQLKSTERYDYNTLFKIEQDTGEVTVNNTLDYSQASIVILTIKVTDVNADVNIDSQFAVTELTVYVQPYSDSNPQFSNPGWTSARATVVMKVKEEIASGSTIGILAAEDPISGHAVTNFKVINSETDLLQVDTQSGQIMLTKRLDYEELLSPNLTLTVKATSNDGSKYSIAKVVIQVANINDNAPEFEKTLYKISLLESVKFPEMVVSVKAADGDAVLTDEDRKLGFSDIRYSLTGDNADLFIIDEITGVVEVAGNKSLDRERQSVLRLVAMATDAPGGIHQRSASAQLLVDVLDVNDNAPHFEKATFTAVVPENVGAGVSVVNVTAFDPDEGLGGEVKYDLMNEGEANGLFQINASTGEIKTHRALTGRGRTEPYNLVVRAQDGGELHEDAALVLYIGDVSANDGIPVFIQPTPNQAASVSENATIGSPVFQVVASDPDDPTQPSGKLYYTIQQKNIDSKSFQIDQSSGLITTAALLDRERQERYQLVVQVWDRGAPPQQASRILQVHVTDVDDHKPRFTRTLDDPPLLMSVEEETPLDTVVGELRALDEDIGANGAIDYAIISGNDEGIFSLTRTEDNRAVIKLAGRVDREAASHHHLTVKCFKLGSDTKISKSYNRLDPSEIEIAIKVLDIDDHLPEFPHGNMSIGVQLSLPADSVLATLRATDADSSAAPIRYRVVSCAFVSPRSSSSALASSQAESVLALDQLSGELRTTKNLIHYVDGSFRLTIRANNSGDPQRHTDLHLEVRVVRSRSLLRLVWRAGAGVVRARLPALSAALSSALAHDGLQLTLQDAQPLSTPDGDVDFTSTGACFQLTRSGVALSPAEMLAALSVSRARADSGVEAALSSHGVWRVGACGEGYARRTHAAPASLAQAWLLAVAAAVGLAAFAAAVAVCCLHNKYRRRSKRLLQAEMDPRPPVAYVTAGSRIYTEPLYST